MQILRSISILAVGFFLTLAVAQELIETGWSLEERCAGEPSPPPGSWTLPGAILLTGPMGIHAVSARFDTPYVVAFLRQGNVRGGALSPDGRWYASPYGTVLNDSEIDVEITLLNEIRAYSTINDAVYRLNIPLAEFLQADYGQVHWQDNEQIVYHSPTSGTLAVHISSGEQSSLEILDDFFTGHNASINFHDSPDWRYAVYRGGEVSQQDWRLIDLSQPDLIYSVPLTLDSPVGWLPDSSGFAAEVGYPGDEVPRSRLSILNTSGDVDTVVLFLQESEHLRATFDRRVSNLRWSPDGRYLAFVTTTLNYPTVTSLYVADSLEERVYNTCIETSDGLAWSPDSTKLALMEFYDFRPRRSLMVLDVESWEVYTAAHHAGSVIGWRDD